MLNPLFNDYSAFRPAYRESVSLTKVVLMTDNRKQNCYHSRKSVREVLNVEEVLKSTAGSLFRNLCFLNSVPVILESKMHHSLECHLSKKSIKNGNRQALF